jgi:hypothetical protein
VLQDAQGWSLINHMVAKGNATVATIVMESAAASCGSIGLISAVPFRITTHVRYHGAGEDGFDAEGNPLGKARQWSAVLRIPVCDSLAHAAARMCLASLSFLLV